MYAVPFGLFLSHSLMYCNYGTNYSTAQKLKLYSKYLYSNATFLFTIYPIGSFLNVSMLQNLLLFSFYFNLS